jgi:hypothetical protein
MDDVVCGGVHHVTVKIRRAVYDTTTQTVAVLGMHFVKPSQLTCSVGDHATWVSSSLVLRVMDKASLGIVTIEVSNNRQDFSTDGIEYIDASSLY